MYLKWENELIGNINIETNEVEIFNTNLNPTIKNLFQGKTFLTSYEWRSFLEDRIVSRGRRDIEKILFRCGISQYDPVKIAKFTRAINVKDKCWISFDLQEKYEDIVNKSLGTILLRNQNIEGDSINSPNGQHIKSYGVYNGKFGIYKKRLHPLSTDVESEVAVFLLALKMNIPCCPAFKVDKDTIFSEFLYDFNKESLVHFRNLFLDGQRGENEVENFLEVRPQYETELFQMLVLDFITHQDDRHLSNYGIKISGDNESFYPLYDNGNSLFFEDDEELVKLKCDDPIMHCCSFGPVGTQWDALNHLIERNPELINSVNLNISCEEIEEILNKAQITGYRYDGAKTWIQKSILTIKESFLIKETLENKMETASTQTSKSLPLSTKPKKEKTELER